MEDFFIALLWIKDVTKHIDPREQLEKAFKKFDENESGNLDIEEFKNYMKSRGDALTSEEIAGLDKLFADIDVNENGSIDIDEFVRHLLNN